MIKIRYKQLSDTQVKYIIDNYDKMSYDEIAKNLNISKSKVVAQSIELQNQCILKKKTKRIKWNLDEEKRLTQLINLQIDEIANILNKKPESIIAKIKQFKKMGIIPKDYKFKYEVDDSNFSLEITEWSLEEINNLIDNVKKMGLIRLSKYLKKSTFDTMMKIHELKEKELIKETYWNTKDYSEWTKEDDLFLVEHFEKSKRENIINEVSVKNWKKITGRAKLFGLKRDSHGTLYESPNEKIVKSILNELNIDFIEQKRIDYSKNKFFIVDFLINNMKIIIEAQGDYWHGNPKIFPNPNKTQLEKIANDKKRKQILENMGYKVIYLWENDLVNNYRECLEYISKLCLLAKKTP